MIKLSRSKIELFRECPRCFWLEMRQKVKRPPPAPYTINSAVDYLLKQEFDIYRAKKAPHPIMAEAGIDAVPYNTPDIGKWRHNFTGIQTHHIPTDFLVYGALDDVWINPAGELMVVDYKATGANQHQVYDSYRRQMEIYQWILGEDGERVSPTGYFVFARASKAGGFGMGKAALPFDIFVEPIVGDGSWIPDTLEAIRDALDRDDPPGRRPGCGYCAYVERAQGNIDISD